MSKCNSTAFGVDLVDVDSEFLDAVDCLRRECFVDFPDTNVFDLESDLLEDSGDRDSRA